MNAKQYSPAKRCSPLWTEIVFTQTSRRFYARPSGATYPDSGLGEVCPHGYFFSGAHIRVTVPLESSFQLLQLLAGEMSPLPPLLLLFRIVRVPVIAPLLCAPLLLCGPQIKVIQMLLMVGKLIFLGGNLEFQYLKCQTFMQNWTKEFLWWENQNWKLLTWILMNMKPRREIIEEVIFFSTSGSYSF